MALRPVGCGRGDRVWTALAVRPMASADAEDVDYLMPENWMEFTTRRPKIVNRMMIGSAASRVIAIRPGQSGDPPGVWDRKMPKARVSGCAEASRAISRGHRYSFQALMKVRIARVVIGATLIGTISRKKIRKLAAPSILAASSTSRLMPRKNWRRKNTANGVMNRNGKMMPGSVFSSPRLFMRTKLGRLVKIGGTNSAARNTPNTASRPGHCSLENANADIEQNSVCPMVIVVAMMIEFRRANQKFTDAPEPPWACACSMVPRPSTRLNAPRVKSTGNRLPGSVASSAPLENAVRAIQ